uniref:Uncharacterized protein n=1 Tax=Myoviridae sp. ct9Ns12 TaxID=2826626 RepID=A0A8S5MHH1_9CAUD|nr:MAG TPA: hypothetical protein [Myoviridae sp. ct9Ns12]
MCSVSSSSFEVVVPPFLRDTFGVLFFHNSIFEMLIQSVIN